MILDYKNKLLQTYPSQAQPYMSDDKNIQKHMWTVQHKGYVRVQKLTYRHPPFQVLCCHLKDSNALDIQIKIMTMGDYCIKS